MPRRGGASCCRRRGRSPRGASARGTGASAGEPGAGAAGPTHYGVDGGRDRRSPRRARHARTCTRRPATTTTIAPRGVSTCRRPDALLRPPPFVAGPPRVREIELWVNEQPVEIADGAFRGLDLQRQRAGSRAAGDRGRRARRPLPEPRHAPPQRALPRPPRREQDGWQPMPVGGEARPIASRPGPSASHPYHCHAMPVSEHLASGLYGALIVDPPGGRPPAHEFVLVLCGFDIDGDGATSSTPGTASRASSRGIPIKVPVGELVRVYLVNLAFQEPAITFHLHAETFDVYRTGTALGARRAHRRRHARPRRARDPRVPAAASAVGTCSTRTSRTGGSRRDGVDRRRVGEPRQRPARVFGEQLVGAVRVSLDQRDQRAVARVARRDERVAHEAAELACGAARCAACARARRLRRAPATTRASARPIPARGASTRAQAAGVGRDRAPRPRGSTGTRPGRCRSRRPSRPAPRAATRGSRRAARSSCTRDSASRRARRARGTHRSGHASRQARQLPQ